MRTLLLIVFILCASVITTSAQLTANAGPDKVYCLMADNDIDPVLGADTVAYGGTPPYTYKWEADDIYSIGPYTSHMFASDLLTDTTAANPTMIHPGQDDNVDVTFRLTVTDANNQVSMDTMIVRQSRYTFTMDYYEFTINQGQSIYLNWGTGAYSERPPFQFLWHPIDGLTDWTHESFWASPEHYIQYSCVVTDALGCYVDVCRYTIFVRPVSTNDIELVQAKVFPNPASDKLEFRLGEELNPSYELNIYSLDGKLVYTQTVVTSEFTIDISDLSPGDYLYRITGGVKKMYSGIFVKQ